jgi:N-sulfoglucosamine sulfohydrolase
MTFTTLVNATTLALAILLSGVALTSEAAQPNILIITVDDMNADSLGAYGCKLADTSPNIDRLAKQSLRFEYAHVQVGNCMPSRNVMWSGRYPHNNGVEGFYQVKEIDYPVLADLMHDGGYFTAIRGKVSHSTPYHPYQWDLVLDTLPNGEKAHTKDPTSYGISTSQAIAAAKKADKPFCLMVNVSDPHKPFYGQAKNGATFDDPHKPTRVFTADEVPIPGFLFDDPIVRTELAQYYSSVRRADDCVGNILKSLESAGKTEDTFILFLSDHGMPLPFAKTQLYHHSTWTPLMVRWPGVTKANSHDQKHMVSAVDFLPTLLDIAEIDHPKGFDGRSFEPIIRGQSQPNRDHVLKVYNENSGRSRDPMRGIQSKKHLYLFNAWSNGERVMATATTGTQTCRRLAQLAATNPALKARHKLYQHRVVEELFDVEKDPDCLHNLIGKPEVQSELNALRAELEKQMAQTRDHMLPVFQQRDDANVREAYVLKLEKEAQTRRNSKGAPSQRKQKLISVTLPKTVASGAQTTIRITHELPKRLGTQKLQVTLKGGKSGARIERKIVDITGTGVTEVTFDVPNNVTDDIVQFAAFVGAEFKQSLHHIQTDPIRLKN